MSTDHDFDRIVHDWVETGPTELSDRVLDAARQGVHRTRQRRGPFGSWRLVTRMPSTRLLAIAGVAVVVVVVAAFGFGLLPDRHGIGGPTALPSGTVMPSPSAQVPSRLVLSFHVRPNGGSVFGSPPGTSPDAAAMDTIRDIVVQRLKAAGYVDPAVTFWDGRSGIYVDLPVERDPLDGSPRNRAETKQVRSILEQRGVIAFVPLPADTYGTDVTGGPQGLVECRPLPDDPDLKPLFDGTHLTGATVGSDSQTGEPIVHLTLDGEAARLFADYTGAHVNDFFAIVLDGTVISAPAIREPITSGSADITLGTAADATTQARELASLLQSRALPFQLDFVDATWGPSP